MTSMRFRRLAMHWVQMVDDKICGVWMIDYAWSSVLTMCEFRQGECTGFRRFAFFYMGF